MRWRGIIGAAVGAMLAVPVAADTPPAPAPALTYAFSFAVTLAPAIEQGTVDGKRMRFVPITGGTVYGPRLQGEILPGGGDWQAIGPDGLTELDARYTLKLADGTVVAVTNPGVRAATPEVAARIARGETVPPDSYYFRTSPRFTVAPGKYDWLRRTLFVARGQRLPDRVIVDFYSVG